MKVYIINIFENDKWRSCWTTIYLRTTRLLKLVPTPWKGNEVIGRWLKTKTKYPYRLERLPIITCWTTYRLFTKHREYITYSTKETSSLDQGDQTQSIAEHQQ